MFWRNGTALATSEADDWPGLGTWFDDSHSCPECQPYLAEQQQTILAARRRALTPTAPSAPEKADPPGLGEWYASSEACPECQPYLAEQQRTLERALNRPKAPAEAIKRARERARAMAEEMDVPIPDMGRFEWDLPEDHEMSLGGKIAWRIAVYGAIVAIPAILLLTSPFTPQDTVRHYVAAAGCQYAGMVGLDNARQGEPGYHLGLDSDEDGIACEPSAGRRLTRGSTHFIRVPEN